MLVHINYIWCLEVFRTLWWNPIQQTTILPQTAAQCMMRWVCMAKREFPGFEMLNISYDCTNVHIMVDYLCPSVWFYKSFYIANSRFHKFNFFLVLLINPFFFQGYGTTIGNFSSRVMTQVCFHRFHRFCNNVTTNESLLLFIWWYSDFTFHKIIDIF